MVLRDETVRRFKLRVRGGNAYTLVHTVTFTSDMELVPDMCPDKQRSIYDGYNVADALGFVSLEMSNVQMKRDIYGTKMVTLKYVGDQDAGPAPDKEESQPAFYHQLPPDLHLEVIHSGNAVGALDLTVGGEFGASLFDQSNPLLGFSV